MRTRLATNVSVRTVAVLAALLVAHAASAQDNVALNRPYLCSSEVMRGWSGLVDGVTDSDSGPGCFATDNEPGFPKVVTIDLQRSCTINHIAVHNSANGNTRGIILYCSQDGEHFEKLREFIFPQNEAITLNHRFNGRPAQFVRVEFTNTWGGGLGGDNVIFAREVEVFGTAIGGEPALGSLPAPLGDPLVRTRDLRLFHRWGLTGVAPLRVVAFGDSLAECSPGSWPQQVAERLRFARPTGAEVSVAAVARSGMTPQSGGADVAQLIDAQPDVVLVSFGTDLFDWDRDAFRSGLSGVVSRLLAETDALVVLLGPVSDEGASADTARRALREMEALSDLLGVPLVRTETALTRDGLSGDAVMDDQGRLSQRAQDTIATSMLELLLEP